MTAIDWDWHMVATVAGVVVAAVVAFNAWFAARLAFLEHMRGRR